MPTELESAFDCRIGAKKNFIVTSGETWKLSINIVDKNNLPVDLSSFTVSPIRLYTRNTGDLVATLEGITVTDAIVINQDINLRFNMGS